MDYEIKLAKQAEKSLEKLDKAIRERVIDFLYTKVRVNPTLHREPLHGTKKGLWKYRVGDYRIICEIKNSELTVLVIDIGHRREVYR
jgi:mRNA interferase RelE/StbE